MKVISIVNQKGGVSKTTSSVNLAAALAKLNKKVLLIDMDPQSNCTDYAGIDIEQDTKTTKELLLSDLHIKNCIVEKENYDCIPTTISLSRSEMEINNKIHRINLLKNKIKQLNDEYDFVVIDCPPSLGILMVNALIASTDILIPINPGMYAVTGLEDLFQTIEEVRQENTTLNIKGAFYAMVDKRKNFSTQLEEFIKENYPGLLLKTQIRVCANIDKSQAARTDIYKYDIENKTKSRSAEDYIALAKELLND